jgi:hypothetical protein
VVFSKNSLRSFLKQLKQIAVKLPGLIRHRTLSSNHYFEPYYQGPNLRNLKIPECPLFETFSDYLSEIVKFYIFLYFFLAFVCNKLTSVTLSGWCDLGLKKESM